MRRATWRELRVLVTTANGPQLLDTSNIPTCVGLATAVTSLDRGRRPAAVHRSWWQGCVTSRCLGTRHWGLRVWRQVHAGGHCGHFLLEHELPSVGVVAIGAAPTKRGLLVVARRRLWGATRCCSKRGAAGLGAKPCSVSKGGRPSQQQ